MRHHTPPAPPADGLRAARTTRRTAAGAAVVALALAGCAQGLVSPAMTPHQDATSTREDAVVVARSEQRGPAPTRALGTPAEPAVTPETSAAPERQVAPERRSTPRPTETKSAPRTPSPTTSPTKKTKPSPSKSPAPKPSKKPKPTKSPSPSPSRPPEQPAGKRLAALHPFSSDSPANVAIGSGAKFGDKDHAMTRGLRIPTPTINHTRWSIAVAHATTSDPVATLRDTKSGKNYTIHIPRNARTTEGTDGHLSIIQPDGRTAYELYKAEKRSDTEWTSTRVVQTDLLSDGLRDGARASSISHLIGLIRAHEVAEKDIPHVLALGLPDESLKDGFVWPARGQDTSQNRYSGTVPMGSLFAIPPDVDLKSLELTAEGLALGRALQRYGAYVLVRASTGALFAEPTADAGGVNRMKSDYQKKLYPLLRPVTNNSAETPGGGGTPGRPPAPQPH